MTDMQEALDQEFFEIATELANGIFCGNCGPKDDPFKCAGKGCVPLRDGIYEELKAASRRLQNRKRDD